MPLATCALLFGLISPSLKPVRPTCTFYVLKDCPIANRFAPEINRIMSAYGAKGIKFVLEFEDQDLSMKEAVAHAKTYGYLTPVKLDPEHKDARRWGAVISPTAILTYGSRLVYRGRIDNSYAGVGKPRAKVTSHDLRQALNTFLADRERELPATETPAVGCRIF